MFADPKTHSLGHKQMGEEGFANLAGCGGHQIPLGDRGDDFLTIPTQGNGGQDF